MSLITSAPFCPANYLGLAVTEIALKSVVSIIFHMQMMSIFLSVALASLINFKYFLWTRHFTYNMNKVKLLTAILPHSLCWKQSSSFLWLLLTAPPSPSPSKFKFGFVINLLPLCRHNHFLITAGRLHLQNKFAVFCNVFSEGSSHHLCLFWWFKTGHRSCSHSRRFCGP